jgi:hypothetical protein
MDAYTEGRESFDAAQLKAVSCQHKDCGDGPDYCVKCIDCQEPFCDLHVIDIDDRPFCLACASQEWNIDEAADRLLRSEQALMTVMGRC